MEKKIVGFLWVIFIIFVLLGGFIIYGMDKGWIGYMPDIKEMQSPINQFASRVYASDGTLMGTWSEGNNRIFVSYDSISHHVIDALVSTEDERFMEHSGVDARSVGRAVIKRGFFGQESAGGGSTITQQLAKQLYSEKAHSTMERLFQKPVEWVIAVELEKNYTKQEIMTLYLNYFDFLHNAVGIRTAAKVYFNKHPKDLTLNESATLVGMCKNPSYYNPMHYKSNPRKKELDQRMLDRRNVVLQQMVKRGKITMAQYDSVSVQPITTRFHTIDYKEGKQVYMLEYLRKTMMAGKPDRTNYASWQENQFYEDSIAWETDPLYGWCKKNYKADGTNYNIYNDGLKVYTTIDLRMQKYAEDAVVEHVGKYLQPAFVKQKSGQRNYPYSSDVTAEQRERILKRNFRGTDRYNGLKKQGLSDDEIMKEYYNKPVKMKVFTYNGDKDTTMSPRDSILHSKKYLRSALFSMEPQTGYVKAYVGGLDYKHFKFDMAMNGRRQIGSTMKPLVYALAVEDGHSINDKFLNKRISYRVGPTYWSPKNGSKAAYGSMMPMWWGLQTSNNWVTASIMADTDPTGTRLINFLHNLGIRNNKIKPSIGLCLGPSEITAAELASAYTCFVNKGLRCPPIFVTRIEDSEGNVIATFGPRPNEVISEGTSYNMLKMLQKVANAGTGRGAHAWYHGQFGAKTGTTNEHGDAWFVGVVPRLVTAVWVGGEDRAIHFDNMAYGQGAKAALPVWGKYMQKVVSDASLGYSASEHFEIPDVIPVNAQNQLTVKSGDAPRLDPLKMQQTGASTRPRPRPAKAPNRPAAPVQSAEPAAAPAESAPAAPAEPHPAAPVEHHPAAPAPAPAAPKAE